MDSFGKRFKEERLLKRLTQEQLGDKFHVKKSSISRYENDKQMPEVSLLKQFATFFGVSIDYLLCKTDDKLETENCSSEKSTDCNRKVNKFETAQEALEFILQQPSLMNYGVPDLTDEELVEFANDLLQHIEYLSFKYRQDKNKQNKDK
ncbi:MULTISPECIES: helix-turn-helix domain-containing protein [Paraclostridium]|uniref:Helix-turn-helix domain-containing protein n=1 Tax=Paraclostridium bifermentans TaxID=1490 RepID=A0ABY8R1V0_PARBF|nr:MULTISPECIES: helix-turn-helix transcriptional regulator [Paraclostridium]WGX74852.1 helix-turn-helix domain-containing protein [Paraclostridium bifermentans]